MAVGLNTGTLTGYVPRDARFVDGDRPFLSVTVGIDASYKNKEGEWVNNTHWIDIIYRGNREKLAEHLRKGTNVWVRYHLEQYMKGDGDDRVSVLQVVADDLGFLQQAAEGSSGRSSSSESSGRSRRQSKSSDGARSRKASRDDDDDFDEDIWNS